MKDIDWSVQQFVDVAMSIHQAMNRKDYDIRNIELQNQYRYLKETLKVPDEYLAIIIETIDEELDVDITVLESVI